MRRYEVTCVLAPTLSGEEVEQTVESFKKMAEDKGATVVDVDNWGKRRLAFPVKKHTEGYYVVYTLDEEAAEAALELERRFKVTDPVIRFLTVRIDEAQKRAQKIKSQREDRKKNRRAAAAAAARAAEAGPEKEAAEKEDGKAASSRKETKPEKAGPAEAAERAEKSENEAESSHQGEQEPAKEASTSKEKE